MMLKQKLAFLYSIPVMGTITKKIFHHKIHPRNIQIFISVI